MMTLIATGFGAIGALVVQRVAHRWSHRDRMIALRKQWAAEVLDSLNTAWSAQPFDQTEIRLFLPVNVPHELRFVDPSASRLSLWLQLRMQNIHAEMQRAPRDEGWSTYLFFEKQMAQVEPLLAGWASGKLRYGPRAVERWVWADLEESGMAKGESIKAMKRRRRQILRANRVRP